MHRLEGILSGRVSSIRKRVVKAGPRTRRTAIDGADHPGSNDLSKLAVASARVRGSRHGRRTA